MNEMRQKMEKIWKNNLKQTNLEKDIIEILRNWDSKYSLLYEQSLAPEIRASKMLYESEKKAVGSGFIATSWISRILRTEFGYSSDVINKNLLGVISSLVQEKTVEEVITKALNPYYSPMDTQLWQNYRTARRGIRPV